MSEQAGNQQVMKKGGASTKIIIGVAGVIIVVLIGVIVYLLKPVEEEKKTPQIVTPDNVEEVIQGMQKEEEKVPVGAYEVTQNTEWIFKDGTSVSSNAFVENSTANTHMVYFVVTLRDTGEEVYVSPYIAIGASLDEITLDKDLDKGTYNAVITYHLVDDEFNDLSQVSMTMRIVVEN